MRNDVWHGDCMKLLPDIGKHKVDMILCDMPYGTTACNWDTVLDLERLWDIYEYICKPKAAIILTASQPFTSALIMSKPEWFRYCWVWDKKKPANYATPKFQPMKYHEDVVVFSRESHHYYPIMVKVEGRKAKKGINDGAAVFSRESLSRKDYLDKEYTDKYPSSILEFSNADQNDRLHPTQKPVALFEYLVNTYTQPGQLVVDHCAGSGTTGVACQYTGRNFVLIEKEQEHYETCLRRLRIGQEKKED